VVAEPCTVPACLCYGTEYSCDRCHGSGWFIKVYGEPDYWGVQDYWEAYCNCFAASVLRVRDGNPDSSPGR
jgi:hypothetical protein